MPTPEDGARAIADAIGFDAVRFTTPEAPAHAEFAAAWLAAGLHGDMGYLEKRHALRAGPLDDDRLLAGARSVIVVALSYHEPSASSGPIARYARGDDYHHILWQKLDALGAGLTQRFPGTVCRGFTDSGPIRERELAARAGIGWQGKHTNLISLTLGNFFFLGALLTTLPLTPDPPLDSGHCGTCTRCLAACPTGALIAPHTMDARRCISYLTIELKGPIPLELRPHVGDRAFGCDDCLAVCPWNERAQAGHERRLMARQNDAVDLRALLALLADDATFQARFAGTALLRPGRAGLRRNVCVALGNTGTLDDLPALDAVARDDPSDLVREHAAWATARIRGRAAGSAAPPTDSPPRR
jgi:epoxyqueuosine reductase